MNLALNNKQRLIYHKLTNKHTHTHIYIYIYTQTHFKRFLLNQIKPFFSSFILVYFFFNNNSFNPFNNQ